MQWHAGLAYKLAGMGRPSWLDNSLRSIAPAMGCSPHAGGGRRLLLVSMASTILTPRSWTGLTIPRRPFVMVMLRSLCASSWVSAPSFRRHCQFPFAIPGKFIRASDPSSRRSWAGMMAVSAGDASALPIMAQTTSRLFAPNCFCKASRCAAGNFAYQPAVVSLSWVPV